MVVTANHRYAGFDTSGDGVIDAWDTSGDGKIDAWDTTGDGQIDRRLNLPDGPNELYGLFGLSGDGSPNASPQSSHPPSQSSGAAGWLAFLVVLALTLAVLVLLSPRVRGADSVRYLNPSESAPRTL